MNGVEAVASWFTPTVLFCVLNLMIGTIFIASTLKSPHTNDEQPPQLVRVPSFFERVKSFNLRSQTQEPVIPAEEQAAVHQQEEEEEEEAHHVTEEPHHVTRSLKSPHTNDEQPPQLVRVPSFFERVKSFNLRSQTQQLVIPAEEQAAVHQQEEEEEEEEAHHVTEEPHHVTRSKSAAVAKVAAAAKVLQKSASEKVWTEREDVEEEERRRPATTREKTAGEDEAVDEKADDFINRFRQQLRLQRLDSLLRLRG